MKSTDSEKSKLFVALERAIKPLVRLMLARGITFTQFTDWLKQIYINIAVQDFSLKDKAITDSRISIVTGIHRKDVRRLRSNIEDSSENKTPDSINLGSKLVATWLSSPELMDDHVAKKIPRLKKNGGATSFEALAEKVTKDVRARALLDELERLGVISIDDNDMVTLVTEAFIPSESETEKTFYLGLGVGDHTNAAVNNVLGNQPAFYDRIVHYNNFTESDIKLIETLSRTESGKLLQLINAESKKISAKHMQPTDHNTKRFSLGVYFYSEDEGIDKNA